MPLPCAFRAVAISRPEWFSAALGGSWKGGVLGGIVVCLAAIKEPLGD